MSDEQTVTPDTGNSAEQAQENWEQRFKDTQGAFTKSQQELAAERSVWEDKQTALQKLAELHPDLFEDEDDEEEDLVEPDENERPLTRAEFKAWEAAQEQKQSQKSMAEQYEADLKTFVNGRELSPIIERAIRAAPVKNAEELKAVIDEALEYDAARTSKPRPRVPHVPTNGQAGTDVPNWDEMTRGEAAKYMAEKVRAGESQT